EETVISFLDSRKDTRKTWIKKFEEYGGYDTVGLVRELCTQEKQNEEYHLSEVQKYEALRSLYSQGLIDRSNEELLKKLCDMTLKQLQSYFNYQYKNSFKNVNHGQVEIVDLIDEDIYEDIKELDK